MSTPLRRKAQKLQVVLSAGSLYSCSCEETLVILRAKCHVVLSPLSLPENETTVNLKSASFIMIMHLHKCLTHIQSQIKPWLLFAESFTLSLRVKQGQTNHMCNWAMAQGPTTSKGPRAVRAQAKYLVISRLYVKLYAGAVALHLYVLCAAHKLCPWLPVTVTLS